ncbi:putative clathrin assembly protein At4g40080 [Cucurbita maxima]|uniref:Clathrin assembly protein At4g40080 n=1 Tax=Cucurbita maxima TaxID=3661 RepID=A0A6J1JCT4_CUCMA|nr:putative clathrin assembly protein At4g40080 [Cucurbita maxima]
MIKEDYIFLLWPPIPYSIFLCSALFCSVLICSALLSMVSTKKLSSLIGLIKDKASQSKAALLAKPNILSFQLALLRATTHDPHAPPIHKDLSVLLSFGKTSRATAAAALEVLMDRLQSTQNSAVALKCLIAIHHIVKNGDFILQDQLSVFPFTGGRNYLKLSDFRDSSNPISWELSSWVRWYAQYIETVLCISRILGFFFVGSSSSNAEREKKTEQISGFFNSDLLKETESLMGLIEEVSKMPHCLHLNGNGLVDKIYAFVGEDYLSATKEISTRVTEFRHRLGCLSFGESVELVCALKRLEDCKEKQSRGISGNHEILLKGFWGSIREIRNLIGESKDLRETGKLGRTKSRMSDSGRFMDQDNAKLDRHSVRFGSERFDFTCKGIPVLGITESYLLLK